MSSYTSQSSLSVSQQGSAANKNTINVENVDQVTIRAEKVTVTKAPKLKSKSKSKWFHRLSRRLSRRLSKSASSSEDTTSVENEEETEDTSGSRSSARKKSSRSLRQSSRPSSRRSRRCPPRRKTRKQRPRRVFTFLRCKEIRDAGAGPDSAWDDHDGTGDEVNTEDTPWGSSSQRISSSQEPSNRSLSRPSKEVHSLFQGSSMRKPNYMPTSDLSFQTYPPCQGKCCTCAATQFPPIRQSSLGQTGWTQTSNNAGDWGNNQGTGCTQTSSSILKPQPQPSFSTRPSKSLQLSDWAQTSTQCVPQGSQSYRPNVPPQTNWTQTSSFAMPPGGPPSPPRVPPQTNWTQTSSFATDWTQTSSVIQQQYSQHMTPSQMLCCSGRPCSNPSLCQPNSSDVSPSSPSPPSPSSRMSSLRSSMSLYAKMRKDFESNLSQHLSEVAQKHMEETQSSNQAVPPSNDLLSHEYRQSSVLSRKYNPTLPITPQSQPLPSFLPMEPNQSFYQGDGYLRLQVQECSGMTESRTYLVVPLGRAGERGGAAGLDAAAGEATRALPPKLRVAGQPDAALVECHAGVAARMRFLENGAVVEPAGATEPEAATRASRYGQSLDVDVTVPVPDAQYERLVAAIPLSGNPCCSRCPPRPSPWPTAQAQPPSRTATGKTVYPGHVPDAPENLRADSTSQPSPWLSPMPPKRSSLKDKRQYGNIQEENYKHFSTDFDYKY